MPSGRRVPGEFALRYWPALLVLSGTLAFSGVALARDIHIKKMSTADLKQVCEKVNGSFTQGPKRYGCGTDCKGKPGTECIVTCESGRRCIAQVIGARVPHTAEQALAPHKRH